MCIGFGNYNKNYKYILLSVFFLIINNFTFGYNYNNIFADIKLPPYYKGKEKEFKQHYFIH